jgi:hypothetical protein
MLSVVSTYAQRPADFLVEAIFLHRNYPQTQSVSIGNLQVVLVNRTRRSSVSDLEQGIAYTCSRSETLERPVYLYKSPLGDLGANRDLAHPVRLRFRIPLDGCLFQFCPELDGAFSGDVIDTKFTFVPSTK